MPTHNISLALRSVQQRRREDALKLKSLRLQIKAGVDARCGLTRWNVRLWALAEADIADILARS